jgi:hypothetical protein
MKKIYVLSASFKPTLLIRRRKHIYEGCISRIGQRIEKNLQNTVGLTIYLVIRGRTVGQFIRYLTKRISVETSSKTSSEGAEILFLGDATYGTGRYSIRFPIL